MVRSLGFRTDLLVRRLAGSVVTDRGDCLVITTPANPTFYWGNFLLVPAPVAVGGIDHWCAEFAREFPDAQHLALGIDSTDGRDSLPADIGSTGLSVDVSTVLRAARLRPPLHPNGAATYRPLVSDDDWAQAVALRIAVGEETPSSGEVTFITRQLAEARELMAGGDAEYSGAFVDGRLAAQLGIVTGQPTATGEAPSAARYQSVETAPADRGRGLAGTLVFQAGRRALGRPGVAELVIVADPDYHAMRLYQALGFAAVEQQTQLERAAPD